MAQDEVPIPDGECYLCGETYTKRGMYRHLRSCREDNLELKEEGKSFHLRVEGAHQPHYWLHLAAREDAQLEQLDQFLRDLWVECCGHLSGFRIEGDMYESSTEGWARHGMDKKLGDVLEPGVEFNYKYDYGSTTSLSLEVDAEWTGRADEAVLLLARNRPPEIPCQCGKLATNICIQHKHTEEGWLCDKCAEEHECDEEMMMPLVNSPRAGVCGYTGSLRETEPHPSGALHLV